MTEFSEEVVRRLYVDQSYRPAESLTDAWAGAVIVEVTGTPATALI